ncbi:MAG: cytochrome c3 family protein [bacterium]
MKRREFFRNLCVVALISGLVFIQSLSSEAGVKGPCSECHTMHNSQDGAVVNEVNGQELEAQSFLIKGANLNLGNPCLGCHKRNASGQYFKDPAKENPETKENTDAPQVNVNLESTDGKMSAAGTYYYVAKDKTERDGKSCRKGHNVAGMEDDNSGNEDELLGVIPPGGTEDCIRSDVSNQLTCAGASGCHGNRNISDPLASIKGGHHSPATNSYEGRYRDGNTVASSYRMLYHVRGRVASNWEYGDHADKFLEQIDLSGEDVNIYQGTDKGVQGDKRDPGPDRSINGFCGECHGCASDTTGNGFHSLEGLKGSSQSEMSSPWKRHPTDIVMKQNTAYWNYPGVDGKDYSQEVPVGFAKITKTGSVNELQKSERVVLCVSCHRAHGSQYDDSLRWDYNEMRTTSTKGDGCFRCHTDKYNRQD